jgi:hypothetical protein
MSFERGRTQRTRWDTCVSRALSRSALNKPSIAENSACQFENKSFWLETQFRDIHNIFGDLLLKAEVHEDQKRDSSLDA